MPGPVRALLLSAALVMGSSAGVSAQTLNRMLLPPVSPACISSPYGPRILPGKPEAGTFHNGIDMPAPQGAPVKATAPGEVIRVQRHGAGGLEMLIQHPGFVGVYSHLGQIAPLIAAGRLSVRRGQTIATVGGTGVSFGMHLHFWIIIDGRGVDPAPFLRVSACTGTARPRTMVDRDGKLPPTRLYTAQ